MCLVVSRAAAFPMHDPLPGGRCAHAVELHGAPTGQANCVWHHGLQTKESIEERRRLTALVRDAKMTLRQLLQD